jgi:hypothetical protein
MASEATTGIVLEAAGKWGVGVQGDRVLLLTLDNLAMGDDAGDALTSGVQNVLIGDQAGPLVSSGSNNTMIGAGAGAAQTTQNRTTAIGYQALTAFAGLANASNTAVGYRSGFAVTTGGSNTFVGASAGSNLTDGSSNTGVGINAGPASASLANTTSIGANASAPSDNTVALGDSSVTAVVGGSDGGQTLGSAARRFKGLFIDSTITAVVGNVTINKSAGNCFVATGTATVTVSNNQVTANSIVIANKKTNSGANTMFFVNPAAGSFTITQTTNALVDTEYRWLVIN